MLQTEGSSINSPATSLEAGVKLEAVGTFHNDGDAEQVPTPDRPPQVRFFIHQSFGRLLHRS